MAAEGGIRDRSRGWGSQANQGKSSKKRGQAEHLCTPSAVPTITGKTRMRLSKHWRMVKMQHFWVWSGEPLGWEGTGQSRRIYWGREAASLGNCGWNAGSRRVWWRFDAEDLWWSVNGRRVGVKAIYFSWYSGYEEQDILACSSLDIRRLLCTVIC